MKITNISPIIYIDNKYFVKYIVKTPAGKNEFRTVSFRDPECAEQYHKSMKLKIK